MGACCQDPVYLFHYPALKTYSLKANDIFLGAFNLKSISFSASIFSDKTHLWPLNSPGGQEPMKGREKWAGKTVRAGKGGESEWSSLPPSL